MITLHKLLETYSRECVDIAVLPNHLCGDLFGMINQDNTICINTKVSRKEQIKTLVHELIHLYDEDLPEPEVLVITDTVITLMKPEEEGYLQFLLPQ